jgi:transposase-like protein
MPRRKIFTASVMRRIPRWIDQGLNATEIADNIGCTVGTLRVRSSQLGISLRRKSLDDQVKGRSAWRGSLSRAPRSGGVEHDPLDDKVELTVVVSKATAERLRRQASLKRMSHSALAACLLEFIARDKLYDAVLDGHDPEDVHNGLSGAP